MRGVHVENRLKCTLVFLGINKPSQNSKENDEARKLCSEQQYTTDKNNMIDITIMLGN